AVYVSECRTEPSVWCFSLSAALRPPPTSPVFPYTTLFRSRLLFDFLDDLFRRAHGDVGRDQDLFELVVKFLAQLIFCKQQAQLGRDAFARLFQGVFDLSE